MYCLLLCLFSCRPEVVVKNKSVMVVKGDRGLGKSTLVANWVRQFSLENPEVKVICHFVGSSGRSRDVTTFLRRCITELREEYLKEGKHQFSFFF